MLNKPKISLIMLPFGLFSSDLLTESSDPHARVVSHILSFFSYFLVNILLLGADEVRFLK